MKHNTRTLIKTLQKTVNPKYESLMKTNVVCYGPGYIACVKTSRYVMSLGIGTRSKEGEELLELSSKLGEKKIQHLLLITHIF
jgi:hypothetical protein